MGVPVFMTVIRTVPLLPITITCFSPARGLTSMVFPLLPINLSLLFIVCFPPFSLSLSSFSSSLKDPPLLIFSPIIMTPTMVDSWCFTVAPSFTTLPLMFVSPILLCPPVFSLATFSNIPLALS
eukprot:TRINITY_DN3304_c0_g1_i1.p3 TRINITY_DN3304_c0_g1~~TRINITY_DN3304_c0_g1_i1.p3  ORF type:complete len:124 (+),score=21.11 TRINITY_DN3304_c0_g1_i1:301-672(+)